MRIVDLLNKDSILLGGAPTSKSEAIDMLIDLQVKGGDDLQAILNEAEEGAAFVIMSVYSWLGIGRITCKGYRFR